MKNVTNFRLYIAHHVSHMTNLKKNFSIILIGDINAKSNKWCINDKTNYESRKNGYPASQFGLHQSVNEPTNKLDKASGCIDLTFTS